MTLHQFESLALLARLRYGSKGFMSAKYCIVHDYTQQKAAEITGCRQSTVSAAVRKIRAAQRLANHGADRH
jgi:hypothetical protein